MKKTVKYVDVVRLDGSRETWRPQDRSCAYCGSIQTFTRDDVKGRHVCVNCWGIFRTSPEGEEVEGLTPVLQALAGMQRTSQIIAAVAAARPDEKERLVCSKKLSPGVSTLDFWPQGLSIDSDGDAVVVGVTTGESYRIAVYVEGDEVPSDWYPLGAIGDEYGHGEIYLVHVDLLCVSARKGLGQ